MTIPGHKSYIGSKRYEQGEDYLKKTIKDKEKDDLWIWIERIREYLLTLEVWRDIDEENWKRITAILLNYEVKK